MYENSDNDMKYDESLDLTASRTTRPQTTNFQLTRTSLTEEEQLYSALEKEGVLTRPNELYHSNLSTIDHIFNKIKESKETHEKSLGKVEEAIEHTIMKEQKDPYLKWLKTMGNSDVRPKFTFTKQTTPFRRMEHSHSENIIQKMNTKVRESKFKTSLSKDTINNSNTNRDSFKNTSATEDNKNTPVKPKFEFQSNKYKLAWMKANILANKMDRKETDMYYTLVQSHQQNYEKEKLTKYIIGDDKPKILGKIKQNEGDRTKQYPNETKYKQSEVIREQIMKENTRYNERNSSKTHRIVKFNYFDENLDRKKETIKTFKDTLHRSTSAGTLINSKTFYNSIAGNRLASKFNPDTVYDIKRMKNKSDGSVTILIKDNNSLRGILNSNYLTSYFDKMSDNERMNYRMNILREFNRVQKVELRELALKLIKYCEHNTIVKNAAGVFVDDIMRTVREITQKYNNKDFPTDVLTRLLQFYSSLEDSKVYKVNMINFAYSMYFHSINNNDSDCFDAFRTILSTIPPLNSDNFFCDLRIEIMIPDLCIHHPVAYTIELKDIKFYNGNYNSYTDQMIIHISDNTLTGIFKHKNKSYYIYAKIQESKDDVINKVVRNFTHFYGRCIGAEMKYEKYEKRNKRNEIIEENEELSNESKYFRSYVKSEMILKTREKNINFHDIEKSDVKINLYLKNYNRPVDRKRLVSTLNGIFLNPLYQQPLTSRLADICDSAIDNFELLTKDYIIKKLYSDVQNRDDYNLVYEMKNYLDEFYKPYVYNDHSLMQNFKNKIIVGKNIGNVNRTADNVPFASRLDSLVSDMEALRKLKSEVEETMEYKSDILF